ncbi:hypothetical protein ACIQ7N_00230 [Lysinibacillus sp. NPDC095746]|uniref:hypothetical protein n=1 Tax=Lysinibacillus sp. NPDC095746 TaxID=3364134 RepID=UPI003810B435
MHSVFSGEKSGFSGANDVFTGGRRSFSGAIAEYSGGKSSFTGEVASTTGGGKQSSPTESTSLTAKNEEEYKDEHEKNYT